MVDKLFCQWKLGDTCFFISLKNSTQTNTNNTELLVRIDSVCERENIRPAVQLYFPLWWVNLCTNNKEPYSLYVSVWERDWGWKRENIREYLLLNAPPPPAAALLHISSIQLHVFVLYISLAPPKRFFLLWGQTLCTQIKPHTTTTTKTSKDNFYESRCVEITNECEVIEVA